MCKRPLLFRSFTGLTVVELDSIYDREITKRYYKHEMQRLSKRKAMEWSIGAAGRSFKLDLKDRFLMLLVYYRLYITYTLDGGFLFNMTKVIFADIQNIEPLLADSR